MTDDMRHYQQLKAELNKTTRNFAGGLSIYLMLVTSFDVRPPMMVLLLLNGRYCMRSWPGGVHLTLYTAGRWLDVLPLGVW